jgi:hypothetical protein
VGGVQAEVHRRSLPIAAPCRVFDPTPEKSFCDHCSTHVHDLSAMTKREATQLVSSSVGRTLCVAYRTAPDGTVLHRPEPRPLGRAAGSLMALGLAACAAHAPEIEHPGEGCRDPQGYEVDCERPGRGNEPRIPDADPLVAERPDLDETETTPDAVEVPPIPGEPVVAEQFDFSDDRVVGLVLVDPEVAPIEEPERMVGAIRVTETTFEHVTLDERKTRRAARRAARRERRSQ